MAALTALKAAQMAEMDAAGAAYVSAVYICADEMGALPHPERYSDEFARLCREESSRDELASSDAVGSRLAPQWRTVSAAHIWIAVLPGERVPACASAR